jgi:hypothetical protein
MTLNTASGAYACPERIGMLLALYRTITNDRFHVIPNQLPFKKIKNFGIAIKKFYFT